MAIDSNVVVEFYVRCNSNVLLTKYLSLDSTHPVSKRNLFTDSTHLVSKQKDGNEILSVKIQNIYLRMVHLLCLNKRKKGEEKTLQNGGAHSLLFDEFQMTKQ